MDMAALLKISYTMVKMNKNYIDEFAMVSNLFYEYKIKEGVKIMYYSEKIIDGILCYKDDINKEYIPFSQETLTKKIVELRKENTTLNLKIFEVFEILNRS